MKALALVLLLAASSSLALTEVVKNFARSRCFKFFIQMPNLKKIILPTIFEGAHYKMICQHWKNQSRFATLYDEKQRIPVFSAYTFTGKGYTSRCDQWKNEPQLENLKNQKDMKVISDSEMDVYFHQAVTRDFSGSSYTRGHVFPRQYARDQVHADATYTFTNVAPQTKQNNGKCEHEVETPMLKEMTKRCNLEDANPFNKKLVYVVTGVVPGKQWLVIKRRQNNTIDQGVNVPSYFWSAYCCLNSSNTRISNAYLSNQNEPNQQAEVMGVRVLNERLTRLYNRHFSVFSKLCLT